MKIYSSGAILRELQYCIAYGRPFSHIRFGDGGLFLMKRYLENDEEAMEKMCRKEGLPRDKIEDILTLWAKYANQANFIDSPLAYYNGSFWPRVTIKLQSCSVTDSLFKDFHKYHKRFGITNTRYCNPESHYLFIIEQDRTKHNLVKMMKHRKVCIITARPEIKSIMKRHGFDVEVCPIVGFYQDHYENSFKSTINYIKKNAKKYDFWLVAAGELGRIYSGYIKACGGRTLDMEFVIDFWCGDDLKRRLKKFVIRKGSKIDRFKLMVTQKGREFINMKKALYK